MTLTDGAQRIFDVSYQLLVTLPYSAMTIPRHRDLNQNKGKMGNGEKKDGGGSVQRDISEKLYQLCTSKESVSLLVAESPGMSPGEAWKKLYGNSAVGNHHQKLSNEGSHAPAQTRNERAAACGKWGPTKPSELFLTVSA